MHLIISLDRTPERWNGVSRRFYESFGFYPERVSAVDVCDVGEDVKTNCCNFKYRELSLGEIACYLSHMKCWQQLLDSDEEWALVMEDDVHFVEGGAKFISSSKWIPKGVDVCQVCSYKREAERCWVDLSQEIKLEDNFSLKKIMRPVSYGAQAYWINRKAAKVGLELSHNIIQPLDHLLFDQWDDFCKTVEVQTLFPFVAYQYFEAHSIIDQDRRYMTSESLSVYSWVREFIFKNKVKLKYKKTKREMAR